MAPRQPAQRHPAPQTGTPLTGQTRVAGAQKARPAQSAASVTGVYVYTSSSLNSAAFCYRSPSRGPGNEGDEISE